MRALLLCLLSSCNAADWSYNFGVGQSMGDTSFSRPVSDSETDATMVYAGLTYSPFVGARHRETMRGMERVEYAITHDHAMDEPWKHNIVPQDEEDEEPPAPEEDLVGDIVHKPETMDEAWIYLLWIAGICGLALTVGHLWLQGVPIPLLPKKKDPEEHEE